MTSRESTGYLARDPDHSHPPLGAKARLMVGLFGLIGWPWLLRSLSGGSKAERARLVERLHLPPEALPNLGSWKADAGFLHLIVDTVERQRPRRVVELGCGATSLILAAALRQQRLPAHVGFDQHAEFVSATRQWLADHGLEADLRHAPLGPAPASWPGLWYRPSGLPEEIDLLVIDGPPWTLHPMTRAGAASLFDRLSPGGIVLLDDAARPGERLVARAWARAFPAMIFELVHAGSKGTLIGRRRAA